MDPNLSKKLCETLLKESLVSSDTIEHFDRFELIIDDIIECFPNYKDGSLHVINNLKKRLGKLLSIRAKAMNVDEDTLKKVKGLVFDAINVLIC